MMKCRLGLLAATCAALLSVADAGTLTGTVEVIQKPRKKTAQRYPGGAGAAQKEVQAMPTVVFVKGAVAGVPAQPPRANYAIIQKGLLFEPNLLIVPVGATVEFPNNDGEFHNVFSYSRTRRFDLGRYRKGESKSVDFDTPGVVKIYCEIHPWMRAAVVVVENEFYTEVGEDGRYTITDLPAGDYTVVVWNMGAGAEEHKVTVHAKGTTESPFKLTGTSPPPIPVKTMTARIASNQGNRASSSGGSCCSPVAPAD